MLLDKLNSQLREAQLARDEITISTLRLLLSEVNNAKIAKGADLTDEDVVVVVQKEAKKRKEAAAGFRQGGREEAAQKEEAELKVLEAYLPSQLSTEELTKIVEDTIKELGATSQADMGKVIGSVMSKVKGQADGGAVSGIVREKLS